MEQRYKRAIVEKENHTVSEKETQETSRTEKYKGKRQGSKPKEEKKRWRRQRLVLISWFFMICLGRDHHPGQAHTSWAV